jgi:transcription elongation factor Elf1
MKKICLKCEKEKELDQFPNKSSSKDGKHSYCKECKTKYYDSKYWKLKKEKGLHSIYRKDIREEVNEYKKTLGCLKCKESRYYVLCFHHLDPNKKEGDVAMMLSRYGKNKIKKEIDKCIVLCHNCHHEFHYLEKQNKITIQEYLNS